MSMEKSHLGAEAPQSIEKEAMLERFNVGRIQAGDEFKALYSDYGHDMSRVAACQEIFSKESDVEQLGSVGEALVYSRIKQGIFGDDISVRGTNLYDDYFHGADLIIEAPQQREPIVSAIDITLNQKDIKGVAREMHFAREENARPIGLDEKLKRVKRHIDYVSDMNPDKARSLGAWLQGGGLHEHRTEKNKELFDIAERAMLLKYYVNPETASDPHAPRYVLGGPQVVLSLDAPFVNRVITDSLHQEAHLSAVDAIIQIETLYGITVLQQYLDHKVRQSSNRNFVFDTHFTTTKAWTNLLNTKTEEGVFETAMKKSQSNSDVQAQIAYYMKTCNAILGV